MRIAPGVVLLVLAVLSFRGVRWAHVLFVGLSIAYFPIRAGFDLEPRVCKLALTADLAAMSMTNYAHMILFAKFFLMSHVQFENAQRSLCSSLVLSATATFAMGAAVEIAQGVTGAGNCRLRDLLPDLVGIVLGAAFVMLWVRVREHVWRRAPSLRPRAH